METVICPACGCVQAGTTVGCLECSYNLEWVIANFPTAENYLKLSPKWVSWLGDPQSRTHCHASLLISNDEQLTRIDLDLSSGKQPMEHFGDLTVEFLPDRFAFSVVGHRVDLVLHFGESAVIDNTKYSLEGEFHVYFETRPLPITNLSPDRIVLNKLNNTKILGSGRGAGRTTILSADIEPDHCVFLRNIGPNGPEYWLIDCRTPGGTFVNYTPIFAHRLDLGDLVQLGDFGWTFSRDFETDVGVLLPVAGIEGASIRLREAVLRHAKNPVTTSIQPGEFVAVVGPSGVGKSTLIKAILGEPRAIRSGQVYVNDRIATEQSSSDRLALGYSSQSSILHTELSAVQVLGFMGDFRNSAGSIDDLLQQVDLPVERWQAPLRQLSGGECNRVRTAAELVHEPRLLLLDEPTSGLDARREEQMLRFLRNLSYRGCTILLVTHTAESHLQYFDKVIKFVTGGDVLVESQSHRVSDYRVLKDCIGPARQALSVWPQTKVCLRREWALLQSELFWRFLLPALIVPLLFGTAIGLAVPQSGKSVLLGYLAVLATIWSGTSLSLNSIVGERSVFQHERLLFLRLRSYLFGKVASLYLVGVVQVLVLLSSLGATRYCLAKFGDDASIYEWLPLLVNWHWSSIILLLVNSASIGCGLIISAFSWHSRPTANFLLPLFMMAQILFSVPIVVSDSASLVNTYGKFHVHSCQGAVDCEGAVESIEPPLFGGYLCKSCRSRAEKEMAERSLVWEGLDLEAKQLLSEAMSKAAEDDFPAPTGQVSLRIAKGLSYLTLSRWGDMALRGTATSKKEAENFRDYLAADLGFARAAVESEPERSRPDDRRFAAEHRNSRIWYLSGFGALILLSVVPPLLVLLVILVQERLVVHFGSRV